MHLLECTPKCTFWSRENNQREWLQMFFLFCLLGSSLAQDFLLTKAIPSAITIIAW